MEFLSGPKLLATARTLCQSPRVKAAIAYWGSGGVELLGLDPTSRGVQVICCLAGGKSDPKEIKLFGRRARQHDKLHAKVIWTPRGALVGSANASSNGLPDQERLAHGLIEAGVLTADALTLRSIEAWFDHVYRRARAITEQDLSKATQDRDRHIWAGHIRRGREPTLFDFVRLGGSAGGTPIHLVLWRTGTTPDEDAAVEQLMKMQPSDLERQLGIDRREFSGLGWYIDWSIPKGSVLVDAHYDGKTLRNIDTWRSFDLGGVKTILVNGEKLSVTFVAPTSGALPFKLTKEDKRLLKLSARALWKGGRGDSDGKIISLPQAARILMSAA